MHFCFFWKNPGNSPLKATETLSTRVIPV